MMEKTNLFEAKHLNACYTLQEFLASKNITINICSDYRAVKGIPTEFLFIEYPEGINLVIEYWADVNNVKFY